MQKIVKLIFARNFTKLFREISYQVVIFRQFSFILRQDLIFRKYLIFRETFYLGYTSHLYSTWIPNIGPRSASDADSCSQRGTPKPRKALLIDLETSSEELKRGRAKDRVYVYSNSKLEQAFI